MTFSLAISKNMKQQKFHSHKADGSSFLYITELNFAMNPAQIHTVIFFFSAIIISDLLVFQALCVQLSTEDHRCCQALLLSGGRSTLAHPLLAH